MTAVVAHAADWLSSLAFLAPVVAVGAWIAIANRRERRRGGDDGALPLYAQEGAEGEGRDQAR